MQSLAWYYYRLRQMSPAEIAWRMRTLVRDRLLDRWRLALGLYPHRIPQQANAPPGFRVERLYPRDPHISNSLSETSSLEQAAFSLRSEHGTALIERAERICAHRLSFLGLEDCFLGQPIDWHRDHASARPAPRGFAADIDYRDFRVTGDCKLVWEPNRHHQLVVLARAFRATGEPRYAEELCAQFESWLVANPFGYGMNWRSPLELGVRLINWVWAIDLVRDHFSLDTDLLQHLLESVYLHCWEIQRKYSRGSSANNHLIGEAAGVYIACAYFTQLPQAARWRAQAHAILCREIERQSWPDGGTREQAIGYQIFVLQFFLLAGLVARVRGEDFPRTYWQRLECMAEFLAALAEGGERLPAFGDADDGYVLDLGDDPRRPEPWLAVAAVLFERSDLKPHLEVCPQTLENLLGAEGRAVYAQLEHTTRGALSSRAFPASGYYLLQCGSEAKRLSVVFDCGELGFGPIAAHGHADALSFTLRAAGRDVFVDPGTYDYFSYPTWRRYFRSTRAHNTVVVDGLDQSEMLGPFLWGQRAQARCLEWTPWPDGGGRVVGEHDGYERLSDPVRHRRTLILDAAARRLVIEDELQARATHDVEIFFHLSEDCRLVPAADHLYRIEIAGSDRLWWLELDRSLAPAVLIASEDPPAGWVSRGYHRRSPAVTLVGRVRATGSLRLVCQAWETNRPA